MRREAFTLIELLVGMVLMILIAGQASLSLSITSQTAKHEAERVAAYIYRMMEEADTMHLNFDLDTLKDSSTGEYYISIKWPGSWRNEDTSFRASEGCTYTDNFPGTNGTDTYSARKKRFYFGGTITIKDAKGEYHYVIIATTEGRIRTSDQPPD